MCKTIINHILAGYPLLYLETVEPTRAIVELSEKLTAKKINPVIWDIDRGIQGMENSEENPVFPIEFLANESKKGKENVLFALNFHCFWDNIQVKQKLLNSLPSFKASGQTFVIVSPAGQKIPCELEKVVTVLDFPLPDNQYRTDMVEKLCVENKISMDETAFQTIAGNGTGLTGDEFENAMALSYTTTGRLKSASILDQKKQMVKKSSSLEFFSNTDSSLENLAGLENLKSFALETALSELSRGILLLGVPGTGKSEFCKGLGGALGLPTLILDFGRLFGSLVGESETKTRESLKIADAMSPCVLMIDEIEKGLGGVSGGTSDGGTSSRVFGTFLSWLQDHTSKVYVVATSNDVSKIPPEFLRAERWDGIFFLDIPTQKEQSKIAEVYKNHYSVDENLPDGVDNYTGAEIKTLYRLAKMMQCDLSTAKKYIIPIATSNKEKIENLRTWAKTRAIPASEIEEMPISNNTRKLTRG